MQTSLALIVGTLDSIPDPIRAMLSAIVLAAAVKILGRRIDTSDAGFNVSFRKTAIAALIGIPLIICFALNWRFVVLVDELPAIGQAPAALWWTVYAVWGCGALWHVARLGQRVRTVLRSPDQSAPEKIRRRLDIWCNRLNIDADRIAMVLDADDRPRVTGWSKTVIRLPRASERWRTGTLDAVLLHELSHAKTRAWQWLLTSEIVAAMYWPAPWLRGLTVDLNRAFQRLADSKASAQLRDNLGYAAALREIGDRIGEPAAADALDPLVLHWSDGASVHTRGKQISVGSSDPLYDRVFWALAQATLAVFLLTGTTLREAREEDERASMIRFSPMELPFSRSEKYQNEEVETRR